MAASRGREALLRMGDDLMNYFEVIFTCVKHAMNLNPYFFFRFFIHDIRQRQENCRGLIVIVCHAILLYLRGDKHEGTRGERHLPLWQLVREYVSTAVFVSYSPRARADPLCPLRGS